MECASCGRENRTDSRFCSGCGTPLALTCGSCDRELAADARFCDGCGAAVEAGGVAPSPDGGEAVRKTVTALFCDLVGSTAFGERVDAESAREAMGRYHAMARSVIEAHDGTVAKFIGDGVMALFGVPEVGPDDAARAVRAGLALQDGFGEIRDHIGERHRVEVGLRVGINTGEVVIADADADIVGDALNIAARLEAACEPGRVLVGESTFRLTRSVAEYAERGEVDAKGKDEPVAAFEVFGAHRAVDEADELSTPFVGRDEELRRLRLVLEDTILERRAALVSVVGSPGVGKTRLAREMRAAVEGGTRAFELRCERAGTATFAPIAELLRSVAGITDAHTVDEMTAQVIAVVAGLDDAERVGELLCGFVGAGTMRSTEEMFLAVRRLFEVLGAEQPVVLVVDDIQWAEPLFLDLLEHLAEWVQTVPLLVVCLARPEIREVRAVLAEKGRRVAEVVNLEGLSVEATSELAARLVGAETLPTELLARIPESTEGNPLFVRELMRMLVDDGVISDASGRWEMVIDVEAVEVPPTINSLLASRVERMAPEERRVLELASVVGSEFPIGAVEAAGDQSRRELESAFERLRRKELIEPTGSYWGDESVYRFHHVLIRDAAYRRLLKGARAELHTAVGDWTERTAAALVGEHEVTIANHFEQAHLFRHELDLDDEETKELGERAARLFHVAAERALEREDLAAAASLARRALGCVDDDDERIAELLLLGCEAVLSVGDVADGATLVDRLDAVAGDEPRLRAWVDCFRVQVAVLTDPEGLHDAERLADEAAQRLEELGDLAGVAKARIMRANALVRLARVGECETELDLALSAARAVDDRRRVTAVLGNAPVAALWGPSPVPRAGGRCLDVVRLLRITTGSPAVEATSIRCQAVLEGLRGRYDTARSMLDAARSSVEELGLTHDLLETEYYAGLVELLAAEPVAAEPLLRKAYEGLGRMGIGADSGQAGAHLARALLLQGRLDEAEELVIASEGLAGQNLQTAIASRSVHAEILSARGRHDEALALADEAVATAAGSDILVDHADAVAARARVRAAAGDAAGAATAAEAANALYEQKGATITVDVGQPALPRRVDESASAPPPEIAADSRSEMFAADDLPAPIARFEELEGGPPSTDAPWNRADELTREWAASSDVAELLGSGVAFEDRRRLVAEPGGERAVLSGMRDNVSAQHVERVDPIAVRGDLLSLHRMTWRSDDGRDLEWELLTVAEFSDGGHPVRAVVFEVEQLAEAVAELDRLHVGTLDPVRDRAALRLVDGSLTEPVNRRDMQAVAERVATDFRYVDHRPASYGSTRSRDRFLAAIEGLFDEVDSLFAYVERWLRVDERGACYTSCYRIHSVQGAEVLDRRHVVIAVDQDGRLTSFEEFSEERADEAIARWEELTAPAPMQSIVERSFGWVMEGHAISVEEGYRRQFTVTSPSFQLELRQAGMRADPDLSGALAFGMHLLESAERLELVEIIETRGARLLAFWGRFSYRGGFESVHFIVERFDVDGRYEREVFVDTYEDALAVLDELEAEEDLSFDLVNTATMVFDRDRRSETPATVVAVRGDEVALYDLGEVDGHELLLIRVDVAGEIVAEERFALGDQTAALARLEEWFVDSLGDGAPAAHETLAKFVSAYRIPDAEAIAAVTSPDIEMINHGMLGQVASFDDADEVVAAIVEMAQVVDSVVEKVHRHSDHVVLVTLAGSARMEGGERWGTHQIVVAAVRDDRIVLVEMWDRADFDAAFARYEELVEEAPPRMSLVERQFEWVMKGYESGPSEGLARYGSLVAPGHRLEGRRSGLRSDFDGDQALQWAVDFAETAIAVTAEVVGTRGARWLAARVVWHFKNDFESDRHEVFSLDVDGRIVRHITVDTEEDALALLDELQGEEDLSPDLVNTATMVLERDKADGEEIDVIAIRGDEHALVEVISGAASELRVVTVAVDGTVVRSGVYPVEDLPAALRDIDERYVRALGDDAPIGLGTFAAVIASLNPPDSDALAALFADDIVSEDHVASARIPGVTGREEATLVTAETNTGIDTVATKVHRLADHVILVTIAQSDRRAAGERWQVENPTVAVERDGLITYFGSWDPGDRDAAVAKFAELAADAGPQKSIAERQFEWLMEAFGDGVDAGFARLGSMISPDHQLEYRRSGLSADLDQDQTLESAAIITETVTGISGEVVATRGARWLAVRAVWQFEGGFESERYEASVFDVEGRLVRQVVVDTEAEALAVLDELEAEEQLSFDLVNSATMVLERDAAEGESIDAVAVRGDEHALVEVIGGSSEALRVVTVAPSGAIPDSVEYGLADLPAALRELDRRYFEGLGERAPAGGATFAAVAETFNPPDIGALEALCSPDFVAEDHRESLVTVLGTPEGREEAIEVAARASEGVDTIVEKVLRFTDHVVLSLVVLSNRQGPGDRWGTGNLNLVVERDGLLVSMESWEQDDLDAALARFDELFAQTGRPRLRNRATATSHAEASNPLARGDLEAFRSSFHPDVRIVSHRHLGSSRESNLDEYLADIRSFIEAGVDSATARHEIVAVRGERLHLEEQRADWGDWEGGSVWMLTVREVDDDGLITYVAHYDGEQLIEAVAELEERFLAGEGAPYRDVLDRAIGFRDAMNRGDLEAQIALVPEGFILVDHGSLGWGTLDREQQIDRLRSGHDVTAKAVSYHPVYHRLAPGVALCEVVVERTSHEGSPSERRYLLLSDVRPGGIREQFDLDQLDAAIARFEELTTAIEGDGPSGLVNRASEAALRSAAAVRADDFDAYRASYHPDARIVGHRHLHSARDRDVDQLIVDTVALRDAGADFAEGGVRTLAIRGERLVLFQTWAPSGAWEMSLLWVIEVDDDGLIVFGSFYDPENVADAHAELDRLFMEGEGAPFRQVLEPIATINDELNRRNVDAQLAAMSDDLVVVDHRPLGWGEQDKAGMAERLREGIAVSDSARSVIPRFVRVAPYALLYECEIVRTTADGSEALSEYLMLATADTDGVCNRCEQYGHDQLDEAIARFDELAAEADTPAGPANQASEMSQRLAARLRAGDFDGYRACYHPDARIVSHLFNRQLTTSENADLDTYVAEVIAQAEGRLDFSGHEMRTLAVRGDRLVLDEFSAPSGDGWETSMFAVRELGDDGRIVSTAYYEPQDLPEAVFELERRYIEGEGAPYRAVLEWVQSQNDAINRGDVDGQLAGYSDRLVAIDHRAVGWGTLDKAGFLDRVRSGVEVASLSRVVMPRFHRLTPTAVVVERIIERTSREGSVGRSAGVWLGLFDESGRIARTEQFDVDQLDQAIARFDELTTLPLA